MSTIEAANLVRKAAEPRPVGDSVKSAIRRASRRLGFSYSRTKDIWYRDARRIDANEIDVLRKATNSENEERGRAEARAAIDRLISVRQFLFEIDPDFHREDVAAIERALVAMGCELGTLVVRRK